MFARWGDGFTGLFRLVLIPWAVLSAFAALWAAARLYPPGDWVPVTIAALAALAVVALPMRSETRLGAALLVGIAIRLLAFQSLAGAQFSGDLHYNVVIADNLLTGRGLTVDLPGYGADMRGMYPPIYLLALAGVRAFGGSALLLGVAADIAAGAALLRLSGGNDRIAAAYFLFPSVILRSVVPLKASLGTALLLGAMLLSKRPFLFGVAGALVALTQPVWAPIPFLAFLLLNRSPQALGKVAAGALLIMLPWWARNYVALDAFVPLTTSFGFSLWVAVFGTYEAAAQAPMPELALSVETGRAALLAIQDDPVAYLTRVARSLVFAFTLDDDPAELIWWDSAGWVSAAAVPSNFAWAGLLLWAMLSKSMPDTRWRAFAIAGAVSVLLGMWLEFGARHRAFVVPLLLLWIASARARLPALHGAQPLLRVWHAFRQPGRPVTNSAG